MTPRTIAIVLAGLVAGGVLALVALRPTASPERVADVQTTGKALIGGPFSLTDQTGRRVTEKDFLGKAMVVFFGFTNCPDICPSGLQVLSAALDKLGPKADLVTPVFITLDAKRDTPEKLAQYLKSFHPKIVGLTGSEDDVAAAAKTYKVYYQKAPDEKNPDNYSYDHASLFYVMGKDGAFVAPIAEINDPTAVAAALEKIL